MANQDTYRLIVRRGPEPNKTFDLDKDVLTLGRDITNDIVINDPEVSRHHARFTRGPRGYNIEDLGSTNGSFIAGQRLSGVRPLNPGEMLGLGETVTLGYELMRATPEAGAAAATMPGAAYAPPQQPQAPAARQEYIQPQQQQPSYAPAPQPKYAQPQQEYDQEYPQDYDAYPPQQPDYGYGAAPQAPPGYDYDPYAVRDEEPRSMFNWILIGCFVIFFFCCCISVLGLVIIDTLKLWEDLPIIKEFVPLFTDVAEALGFI